MKTYTIDDIRKYNPCYDPTRYLPEGWTGTAIDILNVKECPVRDRLWVVGWWMSKEEKETFEKYTSQRIDICLYDTLDNIRLAQIDILKEIFEAQED
jgi:hypothetical protein